MELENTKKNINKNDNIHESKAFKGQNWISRIEMFKDILTFSGLDCRNSSFTTLYIVVIHC